MAILAAREDVTLSFEPELAASLADAAQHLPSTDVTLDVEGTLTGPRAAVRELLAVAVDEAGERVSRAATALLRGEETPAELRAALAQAGALLDLLDRI